VTTYLRILRKPNIAALFAASLVARLPIGINGLAMILFLREETGSFTVPGAVAGGLVLGTGLAAPFMGRLVDRLGAKVLLPIAIGHAAGVLSLLGLGLASAPAAALVATAIVTGALFPPNPSLLRGRFPTLLRDEPELVPSAYALDSVILELTFVTAPLLVALIVVLTGPAAALVLSAALVVIGTVAFVAFLPAEVSGGEPSPEGHGFLGALRSPGIQTLVMTMLPLGFAFGALEVALPAFGDAEGEPELGAILIAIWSLASAVGGFTFGVRPRRAPLADVHRRLTLAFPLLVAPLLLASSPVLMALLLIPAGLFIAPIIATRNELAQGSAPEGTKTEALTWPLTALVGGISVGAAAGGALIDASTWRAAVAAGVAGGAVAGIVAMARRASLRATVAH
jgi:MFS family permease